MQGQQEKKRMNPRAVFDWLMGFIYFGVGMFLIVAGLMGYRFSFPPQEFAVLFGITSTLYGLFRCYRGYKSFYRTES